jgi:hypothetical protein
VTADDYTFPPSDRRVRPGARGRRERRRREEFKRLREQGGKSIEDAKRLSHLTGENAGCALTALAAGLGVVATWKGLG